MRVALALVSLTFTIFWTYPLANKIDKMDILMPHVKPDQRETYLCKWMEMDGDQENYIVKFVPKASKHRVHHLILYGCNNPGRDEDVWNCGEMHSSTVIQKYPQGGICADGKFTILYAWAMDAPGLEMPEGVGFRIGGQTNIQYLVLQMHYLEPPDKPDHSGVTVHMTNEQLPKTAGVLFMAALGGIRAQTKEKFECTCIINEQIELHPFAYRVHTHKLGKVVSGYLVRNKDWYLIGKISPQEPQMFYPLANDSMAIRQGDIVTARCTMQNYLDWDVYVGPTSDDEMCNYYLMYWTEGNTTLTRDTCTTWGPPHYYWNTDPILKNTNIPHDDASTLDS